MKAAIAAGEPAISVDTKKKELVGHFKNAGRELRRQGEPEAVRVHDFELPAPGKVAPYGVYDIAANHGWVSVGIDADTAAFAVESIRRWWQKPGQVRYPNASRLVITADCGGSNGSRVRRLKRELRGATEVNRRARMIGRRGSRIDRAASPGAALSPRAANQARLALTRGRRRPPGKAREESVNAVT